MTPQHIDMQIERAIDLCRLERCDWGEMAEDVERWRWLAPWLPTECPMCQGSGYHITLAHLPLMMAVPICLN